MKKIPQAYCTLLQRNRSDSIVRELISHGAKDDVESDDDASTPLTAAIICCGLSIVRYLLVNAANPDGWPEERPIAAAGGGQNTNVLFSC